MAIIDDFLKAYVYFVESGLPEKLAKQLAESVTGTKADEKTLKSFEPEVKKQYGSKTPKKLATKKERGSLNFINSKISNPIRSKFVLQGLDGTTDSLYSTFRREKEAIKKGMVQQMNFAKENNIAISRKDLDNIIYNLKIYKQLDDKVNQLSNDLLDAGKEPEKIYKDFTSNFLNRKRSGNEALEKRIDEEYVKDQGIFKSMDDSMKKIKQLIDEMEDIRSGKKAERQKAESMKKYEGKGYRENEGIYRTLARQFVVQQAKAGKIDVDPRVVQALETNPGNIDSIKIFRHHFGDDAFDKLDTYIDTLPLFEPGPKYPGAEKFEKLGIVVKNRNKPGNTIAHYNTVGEMDQIIKEQDDLIKLIESGESPFYTSKEKILDGIREANADRAKMIKVKNEIAPEDTKVKPGDELLETADVIEFPKIDDTTDFAKGGIVEVLI
tara:strand:- start:259 stop:1572 length:1314 start_codon:yes stop_codon:yes gene_type:complete